MATLVLSTVGTVLGGPIGGAIGSLIGQSIDQQLLAPRSRGPRLGDLSVQTSSYGTQIPRIYGTMRVAGSVIWATDLGESTQTSGAKGQPDTVYSYSVSFAVALSSRPATTIGRIWADGKLLRGEDGDFKVSTEFRFYPGNETQAIDPLIGSIEGLNDTPAYRGLALAVFESLELADYGNRIPFLTFELIADEVAPGVGELLADASGGIVQCDASQAARGYAALGSSIKSAIEPLTDFYSIALFDDGVALRSPASHPAVTINAEDFGNSADAKGTTRIERDQTSARNLPATVTLAYYDPERDYQTGQARATSNEQYGIEERNDLPAVMSATGARSLAEDLIAKRWAKRDKLVLRLPPRFIGILPGTTADLALSPSRWEIEQVTIDAMVTVLELRPAWRTSAVLPADSGRSVPTVDNLVGAITLALIDIPSLEADPSGDLTLYLAASSLGSSARRAPVELGTSGWTSGARTAAKKAVIGTTTTPLDMGQSYLLDLRANFEVQLADVDQWLTSCDDEGLVQGRNLALVGNELIQFGDALPLGPGQFRLSRVARGRAGTEWAMSLHGPGDQFVLIERDALQPIAMPPWTRAATLTAVHQGMSGGVTATASIIVSGESIRPFAPAALQGTIDGAGSLQISWIRRSRQGLAWVDDVDAPLGEAIERYAILIQGMSGTIECDVTSPGMTIPTGDLAVLGSGPATITVRQVGDWANSRPVATVVYLP